MNRRGGGTIQSLESLAIANEYRFAVAAKRREIAALPYRDGQMLLANIIEFTADRALLSGKVEHWLLAVDRRGPTIAARLMGDCGFRSSAIRLRDLTPRQRLMLAEAVRNNFRVRDVSGILLGAA